MKQFQQFLLCALLAALTATGVFACVLLHSAALAVAQLPLEVRALHDDLIAQTGAVRQDFNRQLALSRRELIAAAGRQADALRIETLAELDRIRDTADRRVGDTLVRADAALQTVAAIRSDLKPTLDRSAAIAVQFDDALPLFLACDHNPDCVFNRYVGASKSIERAGQNLAQASGDFRGALPSMLSTWNRIGGSAADTAANLDRLTKPHWYDRLIGYGLNGVILYRNLNPITNLTIKGAQALSAHP